MYNYPIEMDNPFPALSDHEDPRSTRNYVEKELVKMADSRRLCLTHVVLSPAIAVVHDVIFGGGPEPDALKGGVPGRFNAPGSVPVPDALSSYQVEIQSVDGGPIRYAEGQEETGKIMAGAGIGSSKRAPAQRQLRTKWVELPARCKVPIATALRVLDQMGVGVFPANTDNAREQWWKAFEVHPDLPWYDEVKDGYTDKGAIKKGAKAKAGDAGAQAQV